MPYGPWRWPQGSQSYLADMRTGSLQRRARTDYGDYFRTIRIGDWADHTKGRNLSFGSASVHEARRQKVARPLQFGVWTRDVRIEYQLAILLFP